MNNITIALIFLISYGIIEENLYIFILSVLVLSSNISHLLQQLLKKVKRLLFFLVLSAVQNLKMFQWIQVWSLSLAWYFLLLYVIIIIIMRTIFVCFLLLLDWYILHHLLAIIIIIFIGSWGSAAVKNAAVSSSLGSYVYLWTSSSPWPLLKAKGLVEILFCCQG